MRYLLLVFWVELHGTSRFTLFKSLFIFHQYIVSLFCYLVATSLSLFLNTLNTAFYGFQVFKLKLGINNLFIANRVYATVYVGYIFIVEATQHMDDSICFADIGKEFIAKTFTLAGTFYQSGDIYYFYRSRNDASRVNKFRQFGKAFIGHGNYSHVGFDSTEREIGRLGFCIR